MTYPATIDHLLRKHKLRRTSFRSDILQMFLKTPSAIAHQDIEKLLGLDFDRVTLYRTLKSFEEVGLIHRIVDESASIKYALCQNTCTDHQHQDDHLHFNCERCQSTFCLHSFKLPPISLPEGFRVQELRLSAKGICDKCQ